MASRLFARRRTLRSAGAFLFLLLCLSAVWALEPPTREEFEQMRRDGTLAARAKAAEAFGNHRVAPRLVYNLQRRLAAIQGKGTEAETLMSQLPPGMRGMPTTGNVKVLAILLDFQGTPHIPVNTNEYVSAKLFGDGLPSEYPCESLHNYYDRSSYGQLDIEGNVLGWYTTPYARPPVPPGTDEAVKLQIREDMIKEALRAFDAAGHDFSQYDNDGDGRVDYFMVFWAGADNGWGNFWWGYQTSFSDRSFILDGVRLGDYSWQWVSDNGVSPFKPVTVIHETGHALGLPDYYDYNSGVGPRGGVGGMDMMDGNYGDHNAFSKMLLGWIDPVLVTEGQEGLLLRPSADNRDALMLVPGRSYKGPFQDYFMVQNRRKKLNDEKIPTSGVVVWHVDARLDSSGWTFQYDNSYTSHKLLKLMEANGLELIEKGFDANASSFYQPGQDFGPAATPNSTLYDQGPSGLGVRNFAYEGENIRLDAYDVFDDLTPPTGVPGTPTTVVGKAYSNVTVQWAKGTEADPESGIAGYYLQIGTSPGAADAFSGFVDSRSFTFTDGENGKTYYANVRAVNGNNICGALSGNSAGSTASASVLDGEPVGQAGTPFSLAGDILWQTQTAVSHSGGSAFASEPKPALNPEYRDGKSANLYGTIEGPGTLRFWWKVSSEKDWDFLNFYLDGQFVTAISGETGWAEVSVPLPHGAHRVKWEYAKDPGVSDGSDQGWLDDISVTPLPMKGDLDQSLAVDTADLVILSLALAGGATPGTAPFYASAAEADLDGSGGAPDAADLLLLRTWLAGDQELATE